MKQHPDKSLNNDFFNAQNFRFIILCRKIMISVLLVVVAYSRIMFWRQTEITIKIINRFSTVT